MSWVSSDCAGTQISASLVGLRSQRAASQGCSHVDGAIAERGDRALGGPPSDEARVPRYWLLETLRQYGQQRLRELGEQTTTQQRHLAWICDLADATGAWDDQQVKSFTRMSDERDNLWAALSFCAREPAEVAAGAQAAWHMMTFWACRGPFSDVRRVLTALA